MQWTPGGVMKTRLVMAVGVVALSGMAGCATKQFAQVGDLTDYEKTTMSCREIDLEMAKTQGVQQKIVEQGKFDGRSVLAFLGDFGIGNAMARSSAEEAATKRMGELQAMRAAKGCVESTSTARGQKAPN